MDGFSAAAAGLQVGEQFLKASITAWKLYERLKAAPDDIRRDRDQVKRLATSADEVGRLLQGPFPQHDPRANAISAIPSMHLLPLLDEIRQDFDEFDVVLKPLEDALIKNGSLSRLWGRIIAVKKSHAILANLNHLGDIAIRLHELLALYKVELDSHTASRNTSLQISILGQQTSASAGIAGLHQKFDAKVQDDLANFGLNHAMQAAVLSEIRTLKSKVDALQQPQTSSTRHPNCPSRKLPNSRNTLHPSKQLQFAQRLASKPGLLADTLHTIYNPQRTHCLCHKTAYQQFGPVKWTRRTYGVHKPSCPYHRGDKQTPMAWHYSITAAKLASWALEVAYRSTTGYGGCSVPEAIEFVRIVPGDGRGDSAFDLFLDARHRLNEWDLRGINRNVLEALRDDLHHGLSSHRISTHVQTTNGATLLHEFVGLLPKLKYTHEDLSSVLCEILDLLCRSGVQLNATVQYRESYSDDTVMDTALSRLIPEVGRELWYDIKADLGVTFVKYLLALGVDAAPPQCSYVAETWRLGLLRSCRDTALALEFDLPRSGIAVLNHQTEELRSLLTARKLSFSQDSSESRQLLLLSIGWYAGMSVLLHAGLDPSSAVHYTVDAGDCTALEMLLAAGGSLFTWRFEVEPVVAKNDAHWVYYDDWSLFAHALSKNHDDPLMQRIISTIIDALICSRQQLLDLARTNLSAADLQALSTMASGSTDLPDSKVAVDIYKRLEEKNVTMNGSVLPDYHYGGSVYHNKHLRLADAEALFEAGFHNVDMQAFDGTTPLSRYGFANLGRHGGHNRSMIVWLLKHGAIPLFPQFNRASIWHALAAQLPISAEYSSIDQREVSLAAWTICVSDIRGRLLPDLSLLTRDACQCYCSQGGCSAVSLMIRQMYPTRDGQGNFVMWSDRVWAVDKWLRATHSYMGNDEAVDFCRVEIFESLGMRHVCCAIDFYGEAGLVRVISDEDEVAELQAEDRDAHETLEEVMALFERLWALYRRRRLSLWELWWETVDGYLPKACWVRDEKQWVDSLRGWARVDSDDVPLLDKQRLPDMLGEISAKITARMDALIHDEEQDLLKLEEGMAWFSSVLVTEDSGS